ncbi:MAG: YbaK/EbsC family protein [Ruegeria sp.]
MRVQTGFAIGGVAPVGHLGPIRTYIDQHLTDFDFVWAAAGTPRHVFQISPQDLIKLSAPLPAEYVEKL